MPKIPKQVNMRLLPWEPTYKGKVRDIYPVPGHEDLMAVVVTDRLSVFDVVLGFEIPDKGIVLNTHNVHIKVGLEKAGIVKTDLVAWGKDVDQYLPEELRGNPEIQARTTIVKKYDPIKFEIIIRDRLWGSAAKGYPDKSPYNPTTGMLFGQFVGKDLKPADEFPELVFDPTTKAGEGEHDTRVSADKVNQAYPGIQETAIKIFKHVQGDSRRRGFELVDFKIELAYVNGEFILLDETATLDAARYWLIGQLKQYQAGDIKKLPEMSKEYARDCANELGIEALAEQERWDEAQQVMFTSAQITWVRMIYRYMFMQLTGVCLETYWQTNGVNLHDKRVILVIAGSKSDDPQQEAGIAFLKSNAPNHRMVCSCHGSPAELLAIVGMIKRGEFGDIKAIVAGAGMAAHLPGMLNAFLTMYRIGHIPVLGVGFSSGAAEATDANEHSKCVNKEMAALRSIDQLPGQPVEVQENGFAYFGAEGFLDACLAAAKREFLPKPSSKRDAILYYGEDDQCVLSEAEALAMVKKDIEELMVA